MCFQVIRKFDLIRAPVGSKLRGSFPELQGMAAVLSKLLRRATGEDNEGNP
jgi:hypothetical protein